MTAHLLAPVPTSELRPVAWRRLLWVAWLRYRASFAATAALLAVVAAAVLVQGSRMRSAYAVLQACTPASSAHCRFAFTTFHDAYGDAGFAAAVFVWTPGLIGAFAGAPLLARELETGTFRFAWTQGVGRMRWLIALLVPGALGVVAVTAIFGGLITWYKQPLLDAGIEQRLHGSMFPITGVAVVGWGLAAYAIGVLAGLVVRRVAAALAVTLALWTGLAFLASVLRGRYQTPLSTSSPELPASDLPIEQWWSHAGLRVGDDQINQVLQAVGVQSSNGGQDFRAGPGSGSVDPGQYLLQHGYTQWTSYQPDSRYWGFQLVEFGWLTALSLLLFAATLWLVRRKTA
jgi:hypothetical protein